MLSLVRVRRSVKQKSCSFHVEARLLKSNQLITLFIIACPGRDIKRTRNISLGKDLRTILLNVSFTFCFYICKMPQVY